MGICILDLTGPARDPLFCESLGARGNCPQLSIARRREKINPAPLDRGLGLKTERGRQSWITIRRRNRRREPEKGEVKEKKNKAIGGGFID